ncbi:hypothetical protein Q7P37_002955 [Cladosporium fusiforme]
MSPADFHPPPHSPPSSPPLMPEAPDHCFPLILDTIVRSVASSYSDLTPSENGLTDRMDIDDSDDDLIPDLESADNSLAASALQPLRPLKLARPCSFTNTTDTTTTSTNSFQAYTLTRITPSQPEPKPQLKILLALTPRPASLTESIFFPSLSKRFCDDFSSSGGTQWMCVSLYGHLRAWMKRYGDIGAMDQAMDIDKDSKVGIGSIHPYALRAKLEREQEVQWRLGIPVLLELIGEEVRRGGRAFVVCGLGVGDLDGVRAFGEKIAEPDGILAFLPALAVRSVVPLQYEDRTVRIDSTEPSQIYDALLAALCSKASPSPTCSESEPPQICDAVLEALCVEASPPPTGSQGEPILIDD